MLLWLDRRHAKQNRNWNENFKELYFTTGTIVLYHNYIPLAVSSQNKAHWLLGVFGRVTRVTRVSSDNANIVAEYHLKNQRTYCPS